MIDDEKCKPFSKLGNWSICYLFICLVLFFFYLDEVTKNVVSQPSDDEDDDDLDYDDAEASANGPLSY